MLGAELQVAVARGDGEEGHDAVALQDAETVDELALDVDFLQQGDAEIAGLDVRVV